jgi:hypothetical protein
VKEEEEESELDFTVEFELFELKEVVDAGAVDVDDDVLVLEDALETAAEELSLSVETALMQ